MIVHDKFKEYYKYASNGCNYDDCNQWVSCGPGNTCLEITGKIPCRYCLFWSGLNLTDKEIDYFRLLLSRIKDSIIYR